MSSSNSTLTDLLASTPHRLAFSLPLFFVSLLLTFAGTFLTLDRTRSFPSSYAAIPMPGSLDPQKKRSKFKYVLEGGIGGLAIGYVFGVQLSTFFTLLVPNVSPSAPLSPNAFLAVWILSCVVTTLIGGRYRYCARLFTGICGGALTALALSVIIHPSLLTRQVLVALFAILYPIVVFLCYIPRLHRFLHATFRFSASSAGAFCFILSIAALSKTPAWVNVWERLWLHDGTTWGTSKERGMSAAFGILTCFGVVSDWAFNRWLGECPDEKWDNYLAKYAANLPSDSSRAGTFTPLPSRSLWNRLFGPSGTDEALPPLQPPFGRSTSMGSITKDPLELESLDGFSKPLSYDDPPATGVLRKKSQAPSARFIAPKRSQTKRIRGRRRPIKFGADLSSESEDESSANEADTRVRPWLLQKFSTSSSTPTLVDEPMRTEAGDLKKPRILTVGPDGVDISDYEEDITTPRSAIPGTKRGEPGWVPAFIRQSTSSSGSKDHGGDKQQTNGLPLPVMAPVPTTPSLIQAFNRIAAAQQDAFNSHSPLSQSINTEVGNIVPRHDGLPNTQNVGDVKDFNKEEDVVSRTQRAREWDHFWKEVARKASS